jgi:hypothetical protein
MEGSRANWLGINRLGEELLVWNYQLTPDQLPAWKPRQVQPLEATGWPRSIQSTWSGPEGGLALFDVYECASRVEAQELLLRLLGHVQSAELELEREAPYGDVVFARASAAVCLFARANVVYFIRTAEREPVPIRESAVALDEQLISRPEPAPGQAVPEISRLAAEPATIARGESAALEVSAADPLREPLWYKCFTTSGTLRLRNGRPVYEHTSDSPPQLSVYAVAPGRGAASQDLRLGSA